MGVDNRWRADLLHGIWTHSRLYEVSIMKVTDEMATFIERVRLCFVATISPDGRPHVSPKGSLVRSDHSSIAFAHIRSPNTVANIKFNSSVEVSVINPISRRGYLFVGNGRVVSRGSEMHNLIQKFRDIGIASTIKAAVIIDVNHTEETKSPLYYMGHDEKSITETWKKKYIRSLF